MKKLVMVMVAVLTAVMFMSSVDAEQKGAKDQASLMKCEKTRVACIDKAKFKSDKEKCKKVVKKCESDCLTALKAPKGK